MVQRSRSKTMVELNIEKRATEIIFLKLPKGSMYLSGIHIRILWLTIVTVWDVCSSKAMKALCTIEFPEFTLEYHDGVNRKLIG